MSAPQFDIVFRGVRPGVDPELVKSQFASLFKLDAAKVERIFKSKNITLKHRANERLANIFVVRLLAIGVIAEKLNIEPEVIAAPITTIDNGETASDACAMHQPVEFLYGEHTRRIPFVFSGTGFGYCKIWLVNILVSVLSAGILLPWAQVRSMRYFYQHTQLDHTEFYYKAHPLRIYLAQLTFIAYLFALAYGFLLSLPIFLIGVLIFLLALPFYWLKRNYFEHKHSSYRHIFFRQESAIRDAYMALLIWPILLVFSGGFLAPYVLFKIQQYRFQKKYLGDYEFGFTSAPKKYLTLLVPLLVAQCLVLACLHWRAQLPVYILLSVVIIALITVYIHWRVTLVNLQWNGVSSKLGYFVSSWSLRSYAELLLKNLLLCAITLGFYWPWAKVSLAKYRAEHLAFYANQRFKKWQQNLN